MASVYLKLAMKAPMFFLFSTLILQLQHVAGQASPAPTPCKGATITTNKIKDGFIFREGLSPPLDPGLDRTLPYVGKKSNAWEDSTVIPIDCKEAADGQCSLENMQVYDAIYGDTCSVPWTMCRCTQAEMSQSDTRDPFGRIGSKLRSYVRHVMAFPSLLSGWSEHQNIMFYGSAGSRNVVSNFIHQATHAMDFALGNFSAQSRWTDAVDKDSCVADQAASLSYSEAFAQAMVVHIYGILNNTFSLDTSCMSSQLDILQTSFPYESLFTEKCDLAVKPPASKTVAKNSTNDGVTRPSSSSALPQSTLSSQTTNSRGLSSAAIAGVVIASFAIGILLAFVVYLLWRRRRAAQAEARAAHPHPKAEGSHAGGMTYPMPWATHNDDFVVVSDPSPRRQKDGLYPAPHTRYDTSSEAHHSGRSTSIEGTAFSSRSPPSYLVATTSNVGSR